MDRAIARVEADPFLALGLATNFLVGRCERSGISEITS